MVERSMRKVFVTRKVEAQLVLGWKSETVGLALFQSTYNLKGAFETQWQKQHMAHELLREAVLPSEARESDQSQGRSSQCKPGNSWSE